MGTRTREQVSLDVMGLISKQISLSKGSAVDSGVKIEEHLNIYDDLGFDSVEIMDFVAAIESHFKITLDANSFMSIKTVGEIVDHVFQSVNEG